MNDLVRIDRGELVRIDASMLPREAAYRPTTVGQWFTRWLVGTVAWSVVVAVLFVRLSPMVLIVALGGSASRSIARRLRGQALMREGEEGLALIAASEHEAAARLFDRLCARARRFPGYHSLFVHSRAAVHIERGEHDRAVALLLAVVDAGWIGERGVLVSFWPGVLGRIALAEALRGRIDAAKSWRARAHLVISNAKRGELLLVDVVIKARAAEHHDVLDAIASGWERAENLLPIRHLRVVRLLQAFALERAAGPEYRTPARDEALAHALANVREARPGAYDFLAVDWPDLRQFLDRHQLARSLDPDDPRASGAAQLRNTT